MTTTPAPGVLSARHVAVLHAFRDDYATYIPQFHAQNRKRMKLLLADLDAAIAALSALPAGGGTDFAPRFTESQARGWKAVCATLDEIDPDWILEGHTAGKTGVQRACDAIRRLATPTSGGVDDYVDADEVFLSQGADDVPCLQVPGRIIARFIPGSWDRAYNLFSGNTPAAPAAGKGVDETAALAEFTEYFVKNYPGPNTIISDPNWHAPRIFRAAKRAMSALTRQSVAGDGMVLVSSQQLQSVHSALSYSIGDTDPYVAPDATDDEVRADEPVLWACQQICMMLAAPIGPARGMGGGRLRARRRPHAPAATPTDGGEGKS